MRTPATARVSTYTRSFDKLLYFDAERRARVAPWDRSRVSPKEDAVCVQSDAVQRHSHIRRRYNTSWSQNRSRVPIPLPFPSPLHVTDKTNRKDAHL